MKPPEIINDLTKIPVAKTCPPHYWIIESTCSPAGNYRGVCKKCGKQKYFRGYHYFIPPNKRVKLDFNR